MSNNSPPLSAERGISPSSVHARLYKKSSKKAFLFFVFLLITGVAFSGGSLFNDVSASGEAYTSYIPFLLLGLALIIALGFEFVNGFHDPATSQ